MKAFIAALILCSTLAQAHANTWESTSKLNPVTDDLVYVVYSSTNKTNVKNISGKNPMIIIRCTNEYHLEIMVDWGVYLSEERETVAVRWDKLPTNYENWKTSTNNLTVFSPNEKDILIRMKDHHTLTLQITPYNESPVYAQWSLNGLTKAWGDHYCGTIKDRPSYQ
jgi:hypothetical protein